MQRWIARANQFAARGADAQAIHLLRRLHDRAPDNSTVVLHWARRVAPIHPEIEPRPEDLASARSAIQRVLGVSPNSALAPRLRRHQAWITAVAGSVPNALAELRPLVRPLDPEGSRVLLAIAELAILRENLEAAENAISLARRIKPGDIELALNHARLRVARGRASAAIPMLASILRRRPENREARRMLAGAHLMVGETESAIHELELILLAAPEELEPYFDLAQAALEAGRASRAESAAREAERRAPDAGARAPFLLALSLIAQSRTSEARAALEEAIRREPQHRSAREALAALEPGEAGPP